MFYLFKKDQDKMLKKLPFLKKESRISKIFKLKSNQLPIQGGISFIIGFPQTDKKS